MSLILSYVSDSEFSLYLFLHRNKITLLDSVIAHSWNYVSFKNKPKTTNKQTSKQVYNYNPIFYSN